jgi:hypothetical protein
MPVRVVKLNEQNLLLSATSACRICLRDAHGHDGTIFRRQIPKESYMNDEKEIIRALSLWFQLGDGFFAASSIPF